MSSINNMRKRIQEHEKRLDKLRTEARVLGAVDAELRAFNHGGG